MAKRRRRQYGFGSLQKRGPRWRVQWQEGGRRRSKSFKELENAEAYLRIRLGALERGEAGRPPDTSKAKTLEQLFPKWNEARRPTHRSWKADRSRWENHLKKHFGHLRPEQVDVASIKGMVGERVRAGSKSVQLMLRLMSTWFSDLVDDGHVARNPFFAVAVPKKVRRLARPTYDPKTTPFVERWEDVGRIFFALPEPLNVAYALGAMGGLRTGEGLALRWPHVDLERRRIHVRESIEGPLKDTDSRIVPVLDSLLPILSIWRRRFRAHAGRVVPPLRARASHLDPHTLGKVFAETLEGLDPPLPVQLDWYQATRHTFASHWVMSGGGLEALQEILGHASFVTTQRYAHLKPEAFAAHHDRLASVSKPADSTTTAPAPLRGLKGKLLELTEIPTE